MRALPILLLTTLIGCAPTLDVPAPRITASRPATPLSTITIPITVALDSIMAQVEAAVPRGESAMETYVVVDETLLGDVGLKYEIARGPLRIAMRGNVVRAEAPVTYRFAFAQKIDPPFLDAFWKALGSCGMDDEPPRRAVIATETAIDWSREWRLTSRTTVDTIILRDPCEVTFIRYDISDRVRAAFAEGLSRVPRLVDGSIAARGDFKAYAARAWREMHEPVAVDSGAWLLINPQSLAVGPIVGRGDTVRTAIVLTASPRVVLGAQPTVARTPLPPLRVTAETPPTRVMVEADISYDDVNERLAAELVGRTYTRAGHTVRITEATAWGVGDTLVIMTRIAGDVDGTIYLTGRFAYDPERSELYVDGLDYSIETKHVLANVAEWLSHASIRESIAAQARVPLGDGIERARARMEVRLNEALGGTATLTTIIRSIRPSVVYATETGFRVRVEMEGEVSVGIGNRE